MPPTRDRRCLLPAQRAALLADVGRVHDAALARRLGIAQSTVRTYRLKQGLPRAVSGALQVALMDKLSVDGPMTIRALAEWRRCSKQCLYEALGVLEQRGVVRRTKELPARWVVRERREGSL